MSGNNPTRRKKKEAKRAQGSQSRDTTPAQAQHHEQHALPPALALPSIYEILAAQAAAQHVHHPPAPQRSYTDPQHAHTDPSLRLPPMQHHPPPPPAPYQGAHAGHVNPGSAFFPQGHPNAQPLPPARQNTHPGHPTTPPTHLQQHAQHQSPYPPVQPPARPQDEELLTARERAQQKRAVMYAKIRKERDLAVATKNKD
jgi:hypothetical protein